MVGTRYLRLLRPLRSAATIGGIVALTVMMTLLTQRWLTPSPAQAQSAPSVVQGTEFDLLGTNSPVVARLKPDTSGNGQLTILDATGHQRLVLNVTGMLETDASGNTIANYTTGP